MACSSTQQDLEGGLQAIDAAGGRCRHAVTEVCRRWCALNGVCVVIP